MTSLDLLTKGGDSGKPGIVPGKSGESQMFVRIRCPRTTMTTCRRRRSLSRPTRRSPSSSGGSTPAPSPTHRSRMPACRMTSSRSCWNWPPRSVEVPKETPKPVITPKELDQATKDAIAKSRRASASRVLQLSQSDTGLMFTAVNVVDKFDDAALAQLAPLAGSLADVNLARTKVTDAGLATVAQMKNLQRLRLENTAITDAGLDALKACENLEYLNLFNTADHRCRPRKARSPQETQTALRLAKQGDQRGR